MKREREKKKRKKKKKKKKKRKRQKSEKTMGAVFQSADVVGMFVRRTDERQSLRVERRAPGFSAYRFGTVQDSIVAFSAKPAPAICGGHQHRPRKQFGTSVPTLAASYQVCCRLSD